MTTPLTFGDCHTHLDQYDEAELPGHPGAGRRGRGDVGDAGGDYAGVHARVHRAGERQFDAFYAGRGDSPLQRLGAGGRRDVRRAGAAGAVARRWSASARSGWTTCRSRRTTGCRTRCSGRTYGWPRA